MRASGYSSRSSLYRGSSKMAAKVRNRVRNVSLKRGEQVQSECFLGWVERVGRRLRRSLLFGDALLLEGLVLLRPRAQLGGGLIEGKAHGDGDVGWDQYEKDQAVSPDIATACFIVEFVEMGERLG